MHAHSFCLHEQSAFAPWHRPYLLMYESLLRGACKRAAARFTDADVRNRAQFNCDLLRAPYWDPSWGQIPSLLLDYQATVLDASGKPTTINNPLRQPCWRVRARRCAALRGAPTLPAADGSALLMSQLQLLASATERACCLPAACRLSPGIC